MGYYKNKSNKTEKMINRLHKVIERCVHNNQIESALEAIMACAHLLSTYVIDSDDYLERKVIELSDYLVDTSVLSKNADNRILFYDGICNDARGLKLVYINALLNLGYDITYVVDDRYENYANQKELQKLVKDKSFQLVSFKYTREILPRIKALNNIVGQVSPSYTFIYAFPHDVLAAVVFSAFEQVLKRFKIVLSDMNYNIGNNMADIFIEYREYGIDFAVKKRHIPVEREALLPLFPYFDSKKIFHGFPFLNVDGKRIVFSGGVTHKIEDPNRTFLNVVEKMLEYPDVLFLYAGYSPKTPDNGLIQLKEHYPGRVELIPERDDLFQIMENCDFYLDTYPIAGGLMVNFALAAGTIPLSMTVDCKVLCKTSSLMKEIYFSDSDELLKEFDRLYTDNIYYDNQKKKILEGYLSQTEYEEELQNILNGCISRENYMYENFEEEYQSLRKVFFEDFSYDYFVNHIICRDDYWSLRNILFSYFFRKRISNFLKFFK